jgi:hypothetical protein
MTVAISGDSRKQWQSSGDSGKHVKSATGKLTVGREQWIAVDKLGRQPPTDDEPDRAVRRQPQRHTRHHVPAHIIFKAHTKKKIAITITQYPHMRIPKVEIKSTNPRGHRVSVKKKKK